LGRRTSAGKIPVNLCQRGGAFADRTAHTFHRAGTHVTHREHVGTFVASGARNLSSGCPIMPAVAGLVNTNPCESSATPQLRSPGLGFRADEQGYVAQRSLLLHAFAAS
jgi:hypothetical protein